MATKAKRTTRWLLKKEVKYLISRVREVDAVALEEFVTHYEYHSLSQVHVLSFDKD